MHRRSSASSFSFGCWSRIMTMLLTSVCIKNDTHAKMYVLHVLSLCLFLCVPFCSSCRGAHFEVEKSFHMLASLNVWYEMFLRGCRFLSFIDHITSIQVRWTFNKIRNFARSKNYNLWWKMNILFFEQHTKNIFMRIYVNIFVIPKDLYERNLNKFNKDSWYVSIMLLDLVVNIYMIIWNW